MSTSSKFQVPLLLNPSQTSLVLSEEDGILLDASWFMPNSPRSGKAEFLKKRIPGAQFLDLDEVASPHELGLKHMMPEPHVFAEACGQFGINPETHVVIYDTHGVFSSPRALFMFRAFGHEKSSVLNGGLPAWVDQGGQLETEERRRHRKKEYAIPQLDQQMIRDYEQMISNSSLDPAGDSISALVLDARSKERFTGAAPEPRPGLSSGHMPNSFSLPFNIFLQKQTSKADGSEYTTFREPDDLKRALEAAVGVEQANAIIEGKKSVVTTCGSGMTAAVLWLGLRLLGVKDIALYDESWTGYAMRPSSKIVKD